MAWRKQSRERFMQLAGPLPFLILLVLVLQISVDIGGVGMFVFVLSLLTSFFYIFVKRGVAGTRSDLEARKERVPGRDDKYEGDTYPEQIVSIAREFFFGTGEDDLGPITKHEDRRILPNVVYAWCSFIVAGGVFLVVGVALALVANSPLLDPESLTAPSEQFRGNIPLAGLGLLLAFLPAFGNLDATGQFILGGTMLMTAFIFLTGARNLSAVSEELHRRLLRYLVLNNRTPNGEFANLGLLVIVYVILLMFLEVT